MIERITNQNQIARHKLAEKINEIIDYINHSNHEYKSIDDVVDDVVKSNETAHKFAFTNKYLQEENSKLKEELADTKKKLDKYERALEKIAKDRKIISMTGYSFDNEIYVNTAREVLSMPLDIPEYDNVE